MAVAQSVYSSTWKAYLNNGSTATGAVKTVGVNMGAVVAEDWDQTKAEKAVAILAALVPLMDKTLVRTLHDVAYEVYETE